VIEIVLAANPNPWWRTGAVLRGGNWNNGDNAGVFNANLNNGPSNSNNNVGFRCVRPLAL
jgi:formylglycine-generating enzyme required for sulfatase activity